MELKEDTSTDKYQALAAEYNKRVDSLNIAAADEEKQHQETKKVLAISKNQNAKSDTANLFFEVSILLSSVAVTNKNKRLTYLATGLTVVGIIYILLMLFG